MLATKSARNDDHCSSLIKKFEHMACLLAPFFLQKQETKTLTMNEKTLKKLKLLSILLPKNQRLGNTSLRQRQPHTRTQNSAKKLFVLLSSKKNLKQIIDHIYEQIESKS